MKRVFSILAGLATVSLLTVTAQAENRGEQLFRQNCSMCHTVKGQGGKIGPDLTRVTVRMKERDLKAKLENPKKTNPSTSMPSFKTLSKADLEALLGYLKAQK